MIVSPEVIVEAAGPLGDAPSRPIKAFYNLCGYDPSEESPILLSWIGDFFLSGGLPKMATCSESKQFTVCSDTPVRFDSDERLHVLEAVLKVLDPSILSVTRLPQVENSYLISYPHRRVILQEGQVADRDQLSGGTLDGICVAGMLADILCRKGGLYYCDEMFSHIGSDVEKAVLSVMVDHLGDYEQLFFTTRNADILTMPFPRHTFVFLKKEPCDTGAILSLGASLQS